MSSRRPTVCEHADSCELFALLSLQTTLSIWMENYCEADFAKCARYKLALERRPVPGPLLPNGRELRLGSRRGGGT
jgi:hypothetical protein